MWLGISSNSLFLVGNKEPLSSGLYNQKHNSCYGKYQLIRGKHRLQIALSAVSGGCQFFSPGAKCVLWDGMLFPVCLQNFNCWASSLQRARHRAFCSLIHSGTGSKGSSFWEGVLRSAEVSICTGPFCVLPNYCAACLPWSGEVQVQLVVRSYWAKAPLLML